MSKKVMKLASREKRLGAYCLDKIIPLILFFILLSIAFKLSNMGMMNGFGFGMRLQFGGGALSIFIKSFFILLIGVAYLVVQIYFYTRSTTIGKSILGMQVISSIDGQPIGVWKMILREWFAKKASAAVFVLGYLWVLIDDKNRGWHDKIMDTYVIDIRETIDYSTTEEERPESEI